MSSTPKLGIQRLVEGQQSAEVTVNGGVNLLDAFSGAVKILDRDLSTPPGSPAEGDAYIIASTPAGGWATATTPDGTASAAGDLAVYFGGWVIVKPKGGMLAFVVDEKIWVGYSSVESLWHPFQDLWSTTEYWTGKYNGSAKVYSKAILAQTLPTATGTLTVAHGISSLDIDKRIKAELLAYDAGGTLEAFSIPIAFTVDASLAFNVDGTNVYVYAGNFDFSGWKVDIRLEYCR